jgi:hypothetical protein
MNTPFPGMDPYLEHPALWPGIHARLIVLCWFILLWKNRLVEIAI